MTIKTNRLLLRPFKERDLEDVYDIYRDEATCQFLLHDPWTQTTKQTEFRKKFSDKSSEFHFACELEGKVIGDIAVWYTGMKDTVEVGFVFNKHYSGKGFATEALTHIIRYFFITKKVHRIQANLDARNLASAKLCQRVGMRQEAHFIQDFWSKNEWTDSFTYGMLLADFKSVTSLAQPRTN